MKQEGWSKKSGEGLKTLIRKGAIVVHTVGENGIVQGPKLLYKSVSTRYIGYFLNQDMSLDSPCIIKCQPNREDMDSNKGLCA